jgi:hypothetical protein
MTGRTRHRRRAIVLACLAVIALNPSGCTNSGESYFARLGELALNTVSGREEAPQRELTRAELNRIPYATIAVSSEGASRAYLVPQADNGGYLDYRDAAGNSVRILGGAVAGLETTGHDLEGVSYDRRDPIAYPKRLGLWPSELWREYQFAGPGPSRYVVALKCAYTPRGIETIEIAEIRFTLMHVRERCINARREVINSYWVDESTGFIWKSEQWLGPRVGHVTVEIIRPYSG